MRMMRCLGVMDIWVGEHHEELFNGREIDFDRVLDQKTGYTVADAIAGREDLFVPLEAEPLEVVEAPAPGFDSPIIDPADILGGVGAIAGSLKTGEQFDKLERIPTATVETPGQAPIEPVTKTE